MTRLVLVVAAALFDKAGRVLLAKRPEGKAMAGLWEFPGGKLDEGETPEQALVRELREELGIEILTRNLKPMQFASFAYDNFHLLMPVYACREWTGAPTPVEGQELAWVDVHDLHNFDAPAADLPLFEFLASGRHQEPT